MIDMSAIVKDNARDLICNRLKMHSMYAVIWHGHFGSKFIVKSSTDTNRIGEVYSAIFEEYFDKYDTDANFASIDINDYDSWECVYKLLQTTLNKHNDGRDKDERHS